VEDEALATPAPRTWAAQSSLTRWREGQYGDEWPRNGPQTIAGTGVDLRRRQIGMAEEFALPGGRLLPRAGGWRARSGGGGWAAREWVAPDTPASRGVSTATLLRKRLTGRFRGGQHACPASQARVHGRFADGDAPWILTEHRHQALRRSQSPRRRPQHPRWSRPRTAPEQRGRGGARLRDRIDSVAGGVRRQRRASHLAVDVREAGRPSVRRLAGSCSITMTTEIARSDEPPRLCDDRAQSRDQCRDSGALRGEERYGHGAGTVGALGDGCLGCAGERRRETIPPPGPLLAHADTLSGRAQPASCGPRTLARPGTPT
jgi:hypothetical protein